MIHTYPIVSGAPVNNRWSVRVRPAGSDEQWQSVGTYRARVNMHDPTDVSVALFDFSGGPVEVEVRPIGWDYFYRCDIRPCALGIHPTVTAHSVRFVVPQPCNLSIEINRDRRHNLHLFAGDLAGRACQAFETAVSSSPEATIAGNPQGNNTLDIPAAIRSFRSTQGLSVETKPVTVVVRRAHYDIANCVAHIPSNTTVVFEPGTVIAGSFDLSDVDHVRLIGHAFLQLDGFTRFSGMSGVICSNAHDCEVCGLCFLDPPHYTVMAGSSENLVLSDLKSFSYQGWSDGIDMMACRHVQIEDCFLRTSDDCIALYGSRWNWKGSTRDISIERCVLWADVAHPMMLGTHGNLDPTRPDDVIENVRFHDIDVLEHNEYQPDYLGVMAICAGDGNTVQNVTWDTVRIEAIGHGRLCDIRTRYNKDYNKRPGACVRNIHIRNISFDVARSRDEEPSLIDGYDRDHLTYDVLFTHVVRDGHVCTSLEQANIQCGQFTHDIEIEK